MPAVSTVAENRQNHASSNQGIIKTILTVIATFSLSFLLHAQVNGDGKVDLISANAYGSSLSVLTNTTSFSPASPPVISSYSPQSGTVGTVVTISGTNFSPAAAANIVYFGAVQAAVLSASPTSLQVTVPVSATFAPITVTVNGLTGYGEQPFLPTFAGAGPGISAASFDSRQDLSAGSGAVKVVIADIDGDGKPDLVVPNTYGHSISVYRNISTSGSLTAASFAPPVNLATPPGVQSPYYAAVADVDGDGKPDIIVSDYGDNLVSIYRNTSTPGNISSNSFAARVDFATGTTPIGIAVRDLDGDGKPEIVTANYGDNDISVLRNTSTMGNIAFAPKVDFAAGNGAEGAAIGDLDGDGLPDVVTANGGASTLSLLRNISTPGNIAFAPKVDLAVLSYPVDIAIGDLDGDGKPDLTVTFYLPQTVSVLRNTSTVGSLTTDSFAPMTDFALAGRGHTPALADLDGDGKPDIAVATELNSALSIFQNVSTPGSFTTASLAARVDLSTGYNAWGVAVGDLDGDGRPDVVFANAYDNTISIYRNIVPVVAPPVADATATVPLVISANNSNATVVLNGSLSSDPNGRPLQYTWYQTGSPDPLATGVIAVVVLPVGTNSITLMVSDGLASSWQTITVAVITLAQAVDQLEAVVNADVAKQQSLTAILNAALGAIDRSNPTAAINQLQAFQNQVSAQISPLNSTLANTLIDEAQNIINTLSAGGAASHKALKAAAQANGKLHLNFSGIHRQTYIIEASTNLVDWQMIGVANDNGDGTFDFDDAVSTQIPARYYRVVIP